MTPVRDQRRFPARGDVGRMLDGRTAMAVIRRPDLWWTALGVVRRFAVPGWWRRRPWTPRPAEDLWRFRMVTAYGDPTARPSPSDAVDYLEWCRDEAPTRRSRREVVDESSSRLVEGGDG